MDTDSWFAIAAVLAGFLVAAAWVIYVKRKAAKRWRAMAAPERHGQRHKHPRLKGQSHG